MAWKVLTSLGMKNAVTAALALVTVSAGIMVPARANAQYVRVRAGFRRPYRVWRVGYGWVWVYPPVAPVVVVPAQPAPPPPPPPAQVDVQVQPECPCQEAVPPPPPMPPAPPQVMMPPPPPPPAYPSPYDYVPPPPHRQHSEMQVGLGISGMGFNWETNGLKSEEGGAAAHLRLRPSGHVTWEFALGVNGGKDEFGVERHDVPLTGALMLYPWTGFFAPYGVASAGANFVEQKLGDQTLNQTQALASLGGGLELRLSNHFTVGLDLRYQWRWVQDNGASAGSTTMSGTGTTTKPVTTGTAMTLTPVGDEKGTAYNLTATYYF